jgi:hypothetical protein
MYNTVVSINRLNIHTGLPEPHYPMINEYADTITNLYSGDYLIHHYHLHYYHYREFHHHHSSSIYII